MAFNIGEKTTISFGGTAIAKVLSISGPTESRNEVDTTNLDSTTYREFRFGLIDGGEITVECQFDSTNHAAFHAMLSDTTSSAVSLALVGEDGSTDETITCNAYLSGWDLAGMEVDGNVSATLTLKVDGAVSY